MPTLFSKRVLLGPELRECAAAIEIQDHQILSVVERPDAPAGSEDLGELLIAPAWVNAHTHVALVAARGLGGLAMQAGNMVEELYFRLERCMSAEDVAALAKVGAVDCLLSGTGAIFEHYYQGLAMAGALAETGISAALGPALQDLNGPGVHLLEQHFSELSELAKPHWAARGIVPVIAPHATDTVSPALWRRCRDLAVETGWPVHFHIAQSAEELERSWERHGCGPVEMLAQNGLLDAEIRLLMVHALYLSGAELDLLDGDRHTLGYCPAAQSQFDFPNPVQRWRSRGLPVVLGTDAGSCNDTMDPQAELRMMASGPGFGVSHGQALADFVRTPGPESLKALRAARSQALEQRLGNVELLASLTSTAGDLHPSMPVGVIEPGRWANLQVVDLSAPSLWPGDDAHQALCYGQSQPALWGLMVRGRWIGLEGDLRGGLLDTPWWKATQEEARERLGEVRKRAGI